MSTPNSPRPDATVEARVRRVPRYGVLMGIGAAIGVIVGLILTYTGDFEPSPVLNVVYSPSQVLGFTLLWTVPIGVALGGLVGLLLERLTRRSSRVVRVEHETVRGDDA